ncbi:NACHT domain-containing protein [Actinocorallia longicatena]|uniref:NACHT domain-containing protein n=1 Tax=Actinocorallia longicatena TaxID=111803 RepID=UPI0031D5F8AA
MIESVLAAAMGGTLAKVAESIGRRIGTELAERGRGRREAQEITAWFSGYSPAASLPVLPDLPEGADRLPLGEVLHSDEVQSIVHELITLRLCDGPESEVGPLGDGFAALVAARHPASAALAPALFAAMDTAARDLSDALEAAHPDTVRAIRGDARLTRLNATLTAIGRHTASFAERGFPQSDRDFLVRYRRHLADHHGKIDLPDADRRRRIPIDDLYVAPGLVRIEADGMTTAADLDGLVGGLDRTVLLGSPGAGKTTASQVLIHRHALDGSARTPFLVTLREFAADDPPARSIVGYIEHKLEVFYQCPAPPGLVDRLLLDGAALVVFDGLDELVDTGRRADVTAIVERFCMEYPLSPVLVTSRVIGYDQARLDESQFTCYRIQGFGEGQVREYVTKWFAQDAGLSAAEAGRSAADFVAESASVSDLRSSPLLLSLMCILYRGEGSIPRSRPEVYEQCSTLLFRKWDARRRIHSDLRARHLVEPALRHLAYWLFTRKSPEPAVTARELVTEAAGFFQRRGFENRDDAEAAAREFVDFCRGRAWVFRDAGTTAWGEELYTFTHRTFLEYFAAVQIASLCDSPVDLARELRPRIARQEWEVVSQLALQVKDHTADRGAERFFGALLDAPRLRDDEHENVLVFLCSALAYVSVPAAQVRQMVRWSFDIITGPEGGPLTRCLPLRSLLEHGGDYPAYIHDELAAVIDEAVHGDDATARRTALYLTAMGTLLARFVDPRPASFWDHSGASPDRPYEEEVQAAAERDLCLSNALLRRHEIGLAQFCGRFGYAALFANCRVFGIGNGVTGWSPAMRYVVSVGSGFGTQDETGEWQIEQLDWLARDIARSGGPRGIGGLNVNDHGWLGSFVPEVHVDRLDPMPLAGAGFLLFVLSEELGLQAETLRLENSSCLGVFLPYLRKRAGESVPHLPALDVPRDYQDAFVAWAKGEFSFLNIGR